VNYVDQAIQLIDRQIAELQEVRRRLVGIGTATGVAPPLRRRTVSPEVRKRMAESQRKRWEKAKRKQPNGNKQSEK
jgi:hypothetical protein